MSRWTFLRISSENAGAVCETERDRMSAPTIWQCKLIARSRSVRCSPVASVVPLSAIKAAMIVIWSSRPSANSPPPATTRPWTSGTSPASSRSSPGSNSWARSGRRLGDRLVSRGCPLVPMLRVGMPSLTLCVVLRAAERPGRYSHGDRGNEGFVRHPNENCCNP